MVDEEAAKSNHSCEPGAVDRDAPKKDAFHIQLTLWLSDFSEMAVYALHYWKREFRYPSCTA